MSLYPTTFLDATTAAADNNLMPPGTLTVIPINMTVTQMTQINLAQLSLTQDYSMRMWVSVYPDGIPIGGMYPILRFAGLPFTIYIAGQTPPQNTGYAINVTPGRYYLNILNLTNEANVLRFSQIDLASVFPIAGCAGSGLAGSATTLVPVPAMGMALPAYFAPADWGGIIIDSPPVGGYVIMNPANGPGGSYDPDYAAAVAATQAAGLMVLGYVYSSYAGRSVGPIQVDIDSYNAWYNVDGIFIDECSGLTADIAYYEGLVAYVGTFCVLNTGSIPTDQSYMSMADSVCIFEGDYATYLTWSSPSWASSYPSSEITHLVYNCGSEGNMINAIGLATARNAGYVYVTDDTSPNPWDTLASYWSAELAQLAATAPASSPPLIASGSGRGLAGITATALSRLIGGGSSSGRS